MSNATLTKTTPPRQAVSTLEEFSRENSMAPGRLRMLHVEDNPADALLTQEYIRGVVADVEFMAVTRISDVTAEDAAAAACALLDLSLPDASGLEALHALRGLSDRLPIIVLTGFDDFELGLSAIRDGAEDYLIKNYVDGQMLDRAIRYAIERRRLTVELVASASEASAAVAAAEQATDAAQLATEASLHAQQASDRHDHAKAAAGTHQVSVCIDQESGDYLLACESCSWQADRGDEALVSWAERSLDQMLVRHVTVGARTAPTSPAPSRRGRGPAVDATAHSEEAAAEGLARRDLFALRTWSRGR